MAPARLRTSPLACHDDRGSGRPIWTEPHEKESSVRGKRLPRNDWPEWLQHGAVRGIYVGGCVSPIHTLRDRESAHTHIDMGDQHKRWICFKSTVELRDREIGLHELAHVLTGERHTKRFRDMLVQLGGTLTEYDFGGWHSARAARRLREYWLHGLASAYL